MQELHVLRVDLLGSGQHGSEDTKIWQTLLIVRVHPLPRGARSAQIRAAVVL